MLAIRLTEVFREELLTCEDGAFPQGTSFFSDNGMV
jgi:hypothetical protein